MKPKLFFFIGIVFGFLIFATLASKSVLACSNNAECNYLCKSPSCCTEAGCDPLKTCTSDCEIVYPAVNGSCYYSCNAGPGNSTCDVWTQYGPCSGGWQERYCTSPLSNTEMQVRACVNNTPTPSGNGSPTPNPSVCPDTDPTAVNLFLPTNGSDVGSLSVDLDWDPPAAWGRGCPVNDNSYNVYVSTVNPPVTLVASTVAGTTIANFVAPAPGKYYWRVAALNGTNSALSATWSFTVLASLNGQVFIDNNNVCATDVTSPLAGLSVKVRGTARSSAVSTVDGSYSIVAPTGVYNNIDLLGVPAGYVCSTGCAQSCPTIPAAVSAGGGLNFFISTQAAGWWQAQGGSVYVGSAGGGVTLQSLLPRATDRLILPGTGGTSGALIRGSGTVDLGLGEVSDDLWNTKSRYGGKKMDYSFFSKQLGITPSMVPTPRPGGINMSDCTLGDDYCYVSDTGTNAVWHVLTGQKYVVVVDGDFEVHDNITVDDGGFLAFIVKGDINVFPTVTSMDGVYIMDGNFVTFSQYVINDTNDLPLTVSGSVVTWGAATLGRNLGLGNNTTPAEKFVYRPNLLTDMPNKIKAFPLQWQEVVSGSF